MILGVIGDLHLRDNLGYADHVGDNRIPEKKEILNFIIDKLSDCSHIFFLGDQLNAKNNPSHIIKELVQFVEQFKQKIFVLAGN
jgi:hypothetical protein